MLVIYPIIKIKKKYKSVKEKTRVAVIRSTATEIQRFLSVIIVIIIKRISMYSFSILSNIFKEEKKLRTSLVMAKYGLEEMVSNFSKFEIFTLQKCCPQLRCEK